MDYLKFPMNLILCLLWAFLVFMLWRSRKDFRFVRFMLSAKATCGSIGLFLALCLYIGLTGHRHIIGTWPFALFMLFFQTVLAFVILRGWKNSSGVRWRFLLLHSGLLIAVGSAFWGAPDSDTMRVQVFEHIPVAEAYTADGKVRRLPYTLTLEDFIVSYGEDGKPSDYKACLKIDDKEAQLRVNHPYSIGIGEDLYLAGFNSASQGTCVLQIVYEPWRHCALAGIILMLAGAALLFIGGPKR